MIQFQAIKTSLSFLLPLSPLCSLINVSCDKRPLIQLLLNFTSWITLTAVGKLFYLGFEITVTLGKRTICCIPKSDNGWYKLSLIRPQTQKNSREIQNRNRNKDKNINLVRRWCFLCCFVTKVSQIAILSLFENRSALVYTSEPLVRLNTTNVLFLSSLLLIFFNTCSNSRLILFTVLRSFVLV